MNRALIFVLACVCGLAVANIYYNQPLLVLFAETFQRTAANTSILSMLVQLSYAIGLIVFVPLGDKVCRKKLISFLLMLNTISQILAAVSPSFNVLLISTVLIGLTAVTAQIVIPSVSIISEPENKGKNVASVMTGLFAGILFARTISGFISHYAGWRSVYWFAAGMDIFLIMLIINIFPKIPSQTDSSYKQLIGSLFQLFKTEMILRKSCLFGFVMFAAFSALWGSLAFLLSTSPFNYGSNIVGMFGLAGVVGLLAARHIGSLADRIGEKHVVSIGALLIIAAFLLMWNTPITIWFLIAGILILDLGGRMGLIGNQLQLFTLPQEMRSRLNTVFMSTYFLGGAIGTRLGGEIAYLFGWHGLSILGITFAGVVLIFNINMRMFAEKA